MRVGNSVGTIYETFSGTFPPDGEAGAEDSAAAIERIQAHVYTAEALEIHINLASLTNLSLTLDDNNVIRAVVLEMRYENVIRTYSIEPTVEGGVVIREVKADG